MATMTAMEQELAQLRAENAALKAKQSAGVGVKITDKGAICVFGIGKFPTTLYAGQWEKVFQVQDKIKALMAQAPKRDTTTQAVG